MSQITFKFLSGLGALSLIFVSGTVFAQNSSTQKTSEAHVHAHGNDHNHNHTHVKTIHDGYFEDDQIADRMLSDWSGDWQSVYPLLQSGILDAVMEHKAENSGMSSEEHKAYYEIGYATDVDRILIEGDTVSFYEKGKLVSGLYESDGYEVLIYDGGNRGVRFVFHKVSGDDGAPAYIQFSDHNIAPTKAEHYHLYWGDDRKALLSELSNWPTYYRSALSDIEIVQEMTAH